MKYAVEVGSDAMIIYQFIKTGSGIQKMNGDSHTHTEHRDCISLFLFFKSKRSRLISELHITNQIASYFKWKPEHLFVTLVQRREVQGTTVWLFGVVSWMLTDGSASLTDMIMAAVHLKIQFHWMLKRILLFLFNLTAKLHYFCAIVNMNFTTLDKLFPPEIWSESLCTPRKSSELTYMMFVFVKHILNIYCRHNGQNHTSNFWRYVE
jgi:hypothetical protein